MIQLLLGNMGMAGGGINEVARHANDAGHHRACAPTRRIFGHLSAPNEGDKDRATYLEKRTPRLFVRAR